MTVPAYLAMVFWNDKNNIVKFLKKARGISILFTYTTKHWKNSESFISQRTQLIKDSSVGFIYPLGPQGSSFQLV
jgi:hypothetical protein